MRLTLVITLPLLSLLPYARAKFTQVSAEDARIQYWHPRSTETPTRKLCTGSPQYCHNMWWHEPSAPAAYTTMGPASTLTFDFTGAEGITVYGSRDSSVHPTASLNGVNYAPGTGSRTIFSADNLNPGEKYTLTLTYSSDLTQTGLSNAIIPDGFLVISEIVLDRPEETTTTTTAQISPTLRTATSDLQTQNLTTATSDASITTTSTSVMSPSSHTALGLAPNFSSPSHASSSAPSLPVTEATGGTPLPAHAKAHNSHLLNLILPIVLIVLTALALPAGFAFRHWRRCREATADGWETRIISAYDPPAPSWRLPMQMPQEDSDSGHSQRQLVSPPHYYQSSDFSSSTSKSQTWSYM